MKLLLDLDELADALAIGRTKAKELVRRGDIPSVRIGDRRLVPAQAAEEYVAGLVAREANRPAGDGQGGSRAPAA